jgi:hypothetical protein
MLDWSVTLDFRYSPEPDEVIVSRVDDLIDVLEPHGVVVSPGNGNLGITITAYGRTVYSAIASAEQICRRACHAVGLQSTWPLVYAEAMTHEELDRRLQITEWAPVRRVVLKEDKKPFRMIGN